MTFNRLEQMFHRALMHSFKKQKLLTVFGLLTLCGLVFLFFKAISFHAEGWLKMCCNLLPLFLSQGLFLIAGVVTIRFYHHEIKELTIDYKKLFYQCVEILMGTCYLTLPIVMVYLLLWILFGLFYFLKVLPWIGNFFGMVLSFGPFLLILGTLVLVATSVIGLFLATPSIALNKIERVDLFNVVKSRLIHKPLTNILLGAIALFPLLITLTFLFFASFLTEWTFFSAKGSLESTIQWFFMMLPFIGLLTPGVIFFFNLATEAHIYCRYTSAHE